MKTKLALLLIAVSLLSVMLCSCEVIKFANNMFGILGLETETDINIGINVPGKNCSHSKVVELESIEPTCTTEGITAGKQCGSCKTVIVAQTTIPARGHRFVSEAVVTVAPTSYSKGKSYSICATCNEKIYTEIPALELDDGASVGLEYKKVNGGYAVVGLGTCRDSNVIISTGYKGEKVIGIGTDTEGLLFTGTEHAKSITIPKFVSYINTWALGYCEKYIVHVDNKHFSSVDGAIYSKDGKTLVKAPSGVGIFDVPNGVTKIETSAFSGSSVMYINIPASVLLIGINSDSYIYAEMNTGNLREINVDQMNPNYASLDGVLYNKEMTSLLYYPENKEGSIFEIPSGVKVIEHCAFFETYPLQIVIIPDSVTTIVEWAFSRMPSLKKVTIPNSVVSIGEAAFGSLANLTIYCEAESKPSTWDEYWNSTDTVIWGYTEN